MGTHDQLLGLNKDERVITTLIGLKRRPGSDAFRLVDHWDGDLCAIGIAQPGDERRLAYIALGAAKNSYYLELETAPAANSELPYAVAARFGNLTFEELVTLIAQHLNAVK